MSATELTQEERRKLIAVLRDLDVNGPPERRRTPRRKVLVNLWIRKVKAAGTLREKTADVDMFTGTIVNVSQKGVGLLVTRELAVGDRFVVPLRFNEGGGWLVLCDVRNVTRTATGRYKIGAQFTERMEDPDGNAKVPLDWLM